MLYFPQKPFAQFRQVAANSAQQPAVHQTERNPYQPYQTVQQRQYQQVIRQPPPLTQRAPEQTQYLQKGGIGTASMFQLNDDLSKLKQQLNKLTERGKQFDRAPIIRQGGNQSEGRGRSNLSADNSHNRRREQPANTPLQVYPMKIASSCPTGTAADPGKVIPIYNPNKRQKERVNMSLQNAYEPPRTSSIEFSQVETAKFKQEISVLALEVHDLQVKNKELREQLEQSKLEAKKYQDESQLASGKVSSCERAEKVSAELKKQLESQKQYYKCIIRQLQANIEQHKAEHSYSVPVSSFDAALKATIKQKEDLVLALKEKDDEVSTLKEQLQEKSQESDRLREDMRVQELKAGAELKGKVLRLQLQLGEQSNEIQSSKKTMQAIQQRYKAATREIQEKDDFIMKHLVSRASQSQQQDIGEIVSAYRQILLKEGLLCKALVSEERKTGE